MLEIANLKGIKCIDMWHTLGINANLFSFDPKHPNAAGAVLRGEAAAAFVKSNYYARSLSTGMRTKQKLNNFHSFQPLTGNIL